MLNKFIGTKQFYKGVVAVAAPIIIQNVITNFVSLLDNLMVGQVGTEQMSGVAITNQLLFIVNLGIWGIMTGTGVLAAQYYGKKDYEGVGNAFKFKVMFASVYVVLSVLLLSFFGDGLVNLFIFESEDGLDTAATFIYSRQYLDVMLWGLPFFAVTQAYASTLREVNETKVPMYAGICAILVNLVFNYLLIYGKLGFPELGIVGAAIATNISRIVEAGICVVWAHRNQEKVVFIKTAFRTLSFPKSFLKKAFFLAIPAFVNEFLWSFGQTTLNQAMSTRGVSVVSALNINSMVITVCKSAFLGMGLSIAIIVGNALGAGKTEEAVDTDRKMFVMTFSVTLVIAAVLFFAAPVIPNMYNTTDAVRGMATSFIRISAVLMPMEAIINGCYHTIRCGGRAIVTFLFDAGYTWVVSVPCALIIGYLTNMPIIPMFACVFGINVIKLTAGLILVSKRIWVNTIVDKA